MRRSRCFALLGLVLTGSALSGCNILGYIASMQPPPNVLPAYTGLKGQTVAIMVWADRFMLADHPGVQGDLAQCLKSALEAPKSKDLEGTKVIPVQSVVTYQKTHRGIEALPITEVAARMPATRVIYLQIKNFETRTPLADDIFKGNISVSMHVLEVSNPISFASAGPVDPTKSGPTSRVGFEAGDISTSYPKRNPEGVQALDGGEQVYQNTLRQLAVDVAERFYTHSGEQRRDQDQKPGGNSAQQQ